MNQNQQKNKAAQWAFTMRRTAAATAVAACFSGVILIDEVRANPVNPMVVHGTASFSTAGNILNITNSPNAIINWGSFSIGVNELTRFIQQSGSSAVLNRVIGQDPSAILGALQSNGRVFLINPNGIVFGANAQINVAGLVASTLNLSNDDFLNNRMKFTDGAGAGSVVNQGSISGGSVYLIGKAVSNDGLITSPNGEVILAAGNSVELVNPGTPNLRVEIVAPDNEAKNLGAITADAGRIGIYAGLVNNSGTLRADSAVVEGGRIVLKASKNVHLAAGSQTSVSGTSGGRIDIQAGDTTIVEGDIAATGSAGAGGTVKVLGNLVGLTGHANIDASGDTQGGTVLVGGDYQGRNPDVQNAFRTYVGPDVTIHADAITAGDGGRVIVWADDATRSYGNISARGGAQGGDGGFVETSGKGYLAVTRAPDISAPAGQGGTWLLDPLNITVTSTDLNILDIDPGADANFQPTVGSSTIAASTIVGALNSGNVILDTNVAGADAGNIIIGSAITAAPGVTRSLTFNANNNIDVNASITSTSGALNIVFNPGGAVNLGTVTLDGNGGTINAAGKTVNLSGGTATINSDFSIGTLNMSGGATLTGTGNTTVNSAFNWDTTASLGFLSGTGIFTTTGASTLSGAGTNSHRLEGRVWNNTGTASLTGGHFSLNSGATFNNSNTFNVTTSSAIGVDSTGSGTNTFNNSGTVNWNTPGTAGISVLNAFNNSGSVNVNGGTMNIAVGGTDTNGVYAVTSPAILQFSAGTRALSGTSNVSGTGQAHYTGGTVNINGGSYGIGSSGTTTIAGGTLNFNSPAMLSGTLNLSGGTLGGSANVALGGLFNWSGGTVGGAGQLTTSSTATTNITGFVALPASKIWNNGGAVNISGQVDLGDSGPATFNNLAGGVVNITTPSTINWSFISTPGVQDGVIDNAGTFNVNSGGLTSWEALYRQSATGVLNITGPTTLSMQNADVLAGITNIGAGSTLVLSEVHGGLRKFSGATINQIGALTLNVPTVLENTVLSYTGGTGDYTIPAANRSYLGNIEYRASGNLTLAAALSTSTGGNIALVAGSSIFMNTSAAGASVSGAGTIMFTAGEDIVHSTGAQQINTSNGAMLLQAGRDILHTGTGTSQINTGSGAMTLIAGRDIIHGAGANQINTSSGAMRLQAARDILHTGSGTGQINTSSGAMTLIADGDIVHGAGANQINTASGTMLLQAGRDITHAATSNFNTGSGSMIINAGRDFLVSNSGFVNTGGAQIITVGNDLTLTSSGRINTSSASNQNINVGNNLTLLNGADIYKNSTAGAQNIMVGGSALLSGGGNQAEIFSLAPQNLSIAGNLDLMGAGIIATGSPQTIIVGGNASLTGTTLNSAIMNTVAAQAISVGGALTLQGSMVSSGTAGIFGVNQGITVGGNVSLTGGSGPNAFARISGSPDVGSAVNPVKVGGVIQMTAGTGAGASASIESTSPTSIYVLFPNLESGGYFVNGVEGTVYDAATGTGFIAGGSPAVLGSSLKVTYGGGGVVFGGAALEVPTQTLIVALGESTEPPEAEKDKDVFKETEDDKKKDAPVCK
ncbi:MAG: filamentous hemagglutinin N-terminal domain-containing protein [Burkholderiales bacterium]|jgi:filamentous hemagglutinin family protein|nr:filamentous hemagglutinin N-terminal domain-containing protein [Burkholderiales bacterium]